MFFDSHVHLNLRPLSEEVDAVVARAHEAGVHEMVVVGTELATTRSAADVAEKFPGCHATAGIHPHCAGETGIGELAEIDDLIRSGRFVGVGEIGLDYFRNRSPKKDQRRVFRAQIEMAIDVGLPIVIHLREAYDEGLGILADYPGLRGVLHCFGGEEAHAARGLELGFHVSFAGPLTFPKADRTREVAATVPLERTLIETDCPFLAPQPIRGKTNEPASVRWIAEAQAKLRDLDVEHVARVTTENARRLFGLAENEDS
jgi:TatD DNase family protein